MEWSHHIWNIARCTPRSTDININVWLSSTRHFSLLFATWLWCSVFTEYTIQNSILSDVICFIWLLGEWTQRLLKLLMEKGRKMGFVLVKGHTLTPYIFTCEIQQTHAYSFLFASCDDVSLFHRHQPPFLWLYPKRCVCVCVWARMWILRNTHYITLIYILLLLLLLFIIITI